MSVLLTAKPKVLLDDFLNRCRYVKNDIDLSAVYKSLMAHLRYVRNPDEEPPDDMIQELEDRWYASIADGGAPDYSVYTSDFYLAELYACWSVYSRKHLLGLQHPKSAIDHSVVDHFGRVRSLIDMGCGLGYTTAAFVKYLPRC